MKYKLIRMMHQEYSLVVGVIVLACISACASSQSQAGNSDCGLDLYGHAYNYLLEDSIARQYYQNMYLDTGKYDFAISDTIVPFRTYDFLDTLVVLRHGIVESENQQLFVKMRRQEAELNNIYKTRNSNANAYKLTKLGSGQDAFLQMRVSHILYDVIPGFAMFTVSVKPNLSDAMEIALRSKGVATNEWLEYMFIIRNCQIDRVLVVRLTT